MRNLLTILLSVAMGAAGQILLKVGSNKLKVFNLAPESFIQDIFRMVKTPEILLGLFLFGSSFLLWLKVLTKNDLSYAYPMVSLSYVIIVIASRMIFNEPLGAYKALGIAVIILGVYLINL